MTSSGAPSTDFVQDAFCPMIAVLTSHEAEQVCQKNYLSFVELLQPFSRLKNEVQFKDPGNNYQPVRRLKLSFRSMIDGPPAATLAKKLLNDVVANNAASHLDTNKLPQVIFNGYNLQASVKTPWFDAYREAFLSLIIPAEHEYMRHFLGCLFVVSGNQPDPVGQLQKLTQMQHQQQHQHPHKVPKWFCPNVLRYYIVLHDNSSGDLAKSEEVYNRVKQTYGASQSHLLKINSGRGDLSDSLPNPWAQFQVAQENNYTSETDDNTTDGDVTVSASESLMALDEIANNTNDQINHADDSHPLALTPDSPPGSPPATPQGPQGKCLTLADHEVLRTMVQDFISQGLMPWVEKTLRNLSEQVQVRRGLGRTVASMGWNKLFGKNKPSSLEKSNVVYTQEAPEMQMRRLADLAFLFQLYELAYQNYNSCKKDFQKDQAWNYHAGCLEMAALATYMQGSNNQRQFPGHNMDAATSTYLTTCKLPYFATRCTILHAEILRSKGLQSEAAQTLIRMTTEDSDLRSALFLEQAALCFLEMKNPLVRKYAFHMILAGHRFTKAGQRRHGLRAYMQALQVYLGRCWSLAEDHIQLTIGRQWLALKQPENAVHPLKSLLSDSSRQSPKQQEIFLKEYLQVIQQLQSVQSSELVQLPVPIAVSQKTKVLCFEPLSEKEGLQAASWLSLASDESLSSSWQALAEQLLTSASIDSAGGGSFTCHLPFHSQATDNRQPPITGAQEKVTVEVFLKNPLNVQIVLQDFSLLWSFTPDVSSTVEPQVENQIIPDLSLMPCDTQKVHLWLKPLCSGSLHILGLVCKLTYLDLSDTQPPVVQGKVVLECQGPRLNSTKAEQCSRCYAPDLRLHLRVLPSRPILQVYFRSLPQSMLQGEVKCVGLILINTGSVELTAPSMGCSHQGLYTWGGGPGLPLRLSPGESIETKFWLRAPTDFEVEMGQEECSRHFQAQFLFVYQSEGGSQQTLWHSLVLTLHPSLQISAKANPSRFPKQLILPLTAANHNKVPALAPLVVNLLQIICISQTWQLHHLASGESTESIVSPGESALLTFKLDSKEPELSQEKPSCNHVVFRDVEREYSPLSFPYGVDCEESTERDLDLIIILQWQASRTDGPSLFGHHTIRIHQLDRTFYQPNLAAYIERAPVKFYKEVVPSTLPVDEKLGQCVRVSYHHASTIVHDFTQKKLCLIPVEVKCFSSWENELKLEVAAENSKESELKPDGYVWIGQRYYNFHLQKDSQVSLRAAVSQPGMYNLATANITVTHSSKRISLPRVPASLVIVMDTSQDLT